MQASLGKAALLQASLAMMAWNDGWHAWHGMMDGFNYG
jgi:hypothetical protein